MMSAGDVSSALTTADAQALAVRVGAAMYARDHASRALGMTLKMIAAGHAELTMTVRADMLNGHATCHGGFIFALADSAFAFACNSYNLVTVASGCSIEFLAPGHEGDVLTAVARERSAAGRTGVYDIDVHNQDGALIALFRGKSHRIKGKVVDEAA
jgi:acyl-CoA thioesterase